MRKKFWKWGAAIFAAVLVLCALKLWAAAAEPGAHWTPDYEKVNLTEILSKGQLTPADYQTLLLQTGLGAFAVDTLRGQGAQDDILTAQERFFAEPLIACTPNSPISAEEHTLQGMPLVALEDGDILITPCSHAYGWRNGHAALVVDAAQGLTLESVVLGTKSCLQSIDKWETYPAVMVFRLKGESAAVRAGIARTACERLCGVPYGLTVGLLSPKHPEDAPAETHCAHLVWEAYRAHGYDLDSTGGHIVTPHDLAASPLLELKQIYGVDPRLLWSA